MPTYTVADPEVDNIGAGLVKSVIEELREAEVTVLYLFANSGENDDGPPLKAPGGWPALAKIKVNSLRDRVSGLADATCMIDQRRWEEMEEKERKSLLHHELLHLQVQVKDGKIRRDDAGRPKLRLRLHDFQIGGFDEIVERYGDAAAESQSIRETLKREPVQQLLGFMHG